MKMNKVMLAISIVSLAIGIGFALNYFGVIGLPYTSTVTSGTYSMGVTNSRAQYPFFSTVTPGTNYHWVTQVLNSGSVSWSDSWVTARLGINGAVPTSSFVESCTSGTDVVICKEDLFNWLFQWSADGSTWYSCTGGTYPGASTPGAYSNKVCTIDLGAVLPYSRYTTTGIKTIYWQLTVPASYKSGNYPFIIQAFATAGSNTYTVDGAFDTITIGGSPSPPSPVSPAPNAISCGTGPCANNYLAGFAAITAFVISAFTFYMYRRRK